MTNYIRPRIRAMTALTLYKSVVASSTDAVRQSGSDIDFVPLEFGGISGQAAVLSQGIALKIVDFRTESVEE